MAFQILFFMYLFTRHTLTEIKIAQSIPSDDGTVSKCEIVTGVQGNVPGVGSGAKVNVKL
jgi:hypothetical protein